MTLKPLRSDADHANALRQVELLWGAEAGSAEGDLLDILVDLIDHYEDRHFAFAHADPVAVIRAHMDATGRTQSDLAQVFGSAPRASEILNRKRALTVEMIHSLTRDWGIPAECLIKPYALAA